jgi:hypothetical protein
MLGRASTRGGPKRDSVELLEVVTPRTNAATLGAAEHLFAAVAGTSGLSFEMAGDAHVRRLFVRAADTALRARLAAQLGAAYPQAHARRIDANGDPAELRTDEQVACCALRLAEAEYLPLRVPSDVDIAADRSAQADPLLGVLAALGELPAGWRALAQLVLRPAAADWARPHLRRSLEHALAPEREQAFGRASGWGGVVAAFLLLGAVLAGPRLLAVYRAGGWSSLLLPACIGGLALFALGFVWRRLGSRQLYDVALVQEKLNRPAARTELRLLVFAPKAADAASVANRLEQLAAAYRAYDLERGNRLVARRLGVPGDPRALCAPVPLGPARSLATLGTRELAALWHPVQAADDVSLVERTAARRFLPLPHTVAAGARLGVAEDGRGHQVAAHLAPALLRRHALLVAKTRKGKSGLLRALWRQLAASTDTPRPTVVLIDPHSDLAHAALGLVPSDRHQDVVHLDVACSDRPFGLNFLDVGLGWSRDRMVDNALRVFSKEFDNFWGPRMEIVFRFALLLLVETNRAVVAADPTGGRDRQWTILEVPRVLEEPAFRQALLAETHDRQVLDWWRTFYGALDRHFLQEIINPVQTKTYKFAANEMARAIVGQSRSTIDPWAWIRDGSLVVVDVAKEQVGADIAALLGGTLANLVALAIGRQASLPVEARRHVALLVDEFHALPAADYAALLAELGKYGASLTLATQTLGALVRSGGDQELLHAVFGNVDHLFAFNCAAADARVLAPELGVPLDAADLIELGDYQCYARLSYQGERLPAFHLRLDPPPAGDRVVHDLLAASSALRYGRDARHVAADREVLLERLAQLGRPRSAQATGQALDDPGKGALPQRRPARSRGNRGRQTDRTREKQMPATAVSDGSDDRESRTEA